VECSPLRQGSFQPLHVRPLGGSVEMRFDLLDIPFHRHSPFFKSGHSLRQFHPHHLAARSITAPRAPPATVATKSKNSGVPRPSRQSQMISLRAPTTTAVSKPHVGVHKSPISSDRASPAAKCICLSRASITTSLSRC